MAVAPKAKTVPYNETVRDRGVAHAVYLERLKASESEAVLRHYRDDVVPDLIDRLASRLGRIEARGFDIDPAATKRLGELLEVLQETVDAWTTGLSADLADRSGEIGVAEAKWQDDLFRTTLPVTWDTVVPPVAIVKAAVLESPIDGVLLDDIVGRLGAGAKAQLEKAIRIGLTEGEGIAAITSRVQKVTDLVGSTAEAVARTAVGHASNLGRTAYYQENADLISKVQWVSTLDTRTCASCAALDGQTFPLDKGARPPRHINCRCTTVPVVKSMRELGFDLDDFEPSTRASMNGQVAASTTYNAWLRRMPAAVQDEALGATRGALFRTGKLEVSDFVSRTGDPYNLDELRKRESAAFKSAGA